MSSSIRETLCTYKNLQDAWYRFWKSGKKHTASGVDGLSPADFHANRRLYLNSIADDLRSGYRFSPLRAFPIPKPDGKKYRIICAPTVRDRLVQRMVGDFLAGRPGYDRLIKNDASFGFIKSTEKDRRGVAAARDRAISLRTQHPWAYKSDITAFFDNIPRPEVIDRTVSIFRVPSLRDLIAGIVHCEISVNDPAVGRIVADNGIRVGFGVRQGMPLSPLLSNVILVDFDQGMASKGFRLVRYADDFIVLCDTEDECRRADETARRLLADRFELPPFADGSKTRLAKPNEPIEFLGLSLAAKSDSTYELRITDQQTAKIKERIQWARNRQIVYDQQLTLPDILRRIESQAAGFKVAYGCASNAKSLIDFCNDAARATIRSFYERMFGQDVVHKLHAQDQMLLGLRDYPPRLDGSREPGKMSKTGGRRGEATSPLSRTSGSSNF